jgi:hypothetical protein
MVTPQSSWVAAIPNSAFQPLSEQAVRQTSIPFLHNGISGLLRPLLG